MIVLNNDIPETKEDIGLLMEALSDIAIQHKNTAKEYKLKIKEKQIKALWYCCKIVLDNNLQRDHVHATDIMSVFSKIAKVIDDLIAMDKSPSMRLLK